MKRIILSGLMLMSFYFGAGNLIFAPGVGLAAGENLFSAITGFNLAAVVIPLLALVAVTITGDSVLSFAGRVGKVYGIVFTLVIILSIGPFFAIPRVTNVSFNIGISPIFNPGVDPNIQSVLGVAYVVVFFAVSFVLALYGNRLVDTVGKILSPALIIFILLLIIFFVVFNGSYNVPAATEAYGTPGKAMAKGALEGYGTLDALASLAFAGIIVSAIKPAGQEMTGRQIIKDVIIAGAIACALLAVIYTCLAYIGYASEASGKTDGSSLLVYASEVAFGSLGKYVFGIIVILACLTTAVGLLKTVANYMFNLFGLVSENTYLVIFTVLSAVLSIQGLSSVIKTSLPMIVFTYPITISLLVVTLMQGMDNRAWVYRWIGILVTPVAFAEGYKLFSNFYFGEATDLLAFFRDWVPFMDGDFSWVTPTVLGLMIGLFFPRKRVNRLMLNKEDDLSKASVEVAEEEHKQEVEESAKYSPKSSVKSFKED